MALSFPGKETGWGNLLTDGIQKSAVGQNASNRPVSSQRQTPMTALGVDVSATCRQTVWLQVKQRPFSQREHVRSELPPTAQGTIEPHTAGERDANSPVDTCHVH